MVQRTQHSNEQTSSSIPRQIFDEISTKLSWAVEKTVKAPFLALSSFAEAIAKPVIYSSLTLTALHIVLRPDASKEIASNILHGAPQVIENIITSTPAAFCKAWELSGRVYHTAFKTLGNKVGLAESKQTMPSVLRALIGNAPELAKKARPVIVQKLDSLLTETGKGLNEAIEFAQKTATPWVVQTFNDTFPVQQPTAAKPKV